MLIYKILRADEWAALQRHGETAGAPVDQMGGFIHFSTAAQVAGTLARHFPGETALELLACKIEPLAPDLRWEESRGGQLFPHLFRPLRLMDVAWHRWVNDVDLEALE